MFTFDDAVTHLLDFVGGDVRPETVRDVKRALTQAYREIADAHHWTYLHTPYRFVTDAAYSTGTITYDHTGGASERLVTLSGGTFPSWAANGRMRISDVVYRVDERLSDTTLTLIEAENPGADVAAGTSYSLLRDTYTLPADFRATDRPETYAKWSMSYIDPAEWLRRTTRGDTAGDPAMYTIMPDDILPRRFSIRLYPHPVTSEPINMIYHRRPRRGSIHDRIVFREDAGFASVDDADTAVTGASTDWSSVHVGTILRLSRGAKDYPTGNEGVKPYAFESTVTAVGGAGSLTIGDAADRDYSGVRFVLSDPVDMDTAVLTAFLRAAEMQMALNKNMPSAGVVGASAGHALLKAKEADMRIAEEMVAGRWRIGERWFGRYLGDIT